MNAEKAWPWYSKTAYCNMVDYSLIIYKYMILKGNNSIFPSSYQENAVICFFIIASRNRSLMPLRQ